MKTKLVLTILALSGIATALPAQPLDTALSRVEFGLNVLTDNFGLRPSDIAFRNDYTEPDSLRLKLVANLMAHPLEMIDYVSGLRQAHVTGQPEILAGVMFADLASEHQGSRGRSFQPSMADVQSRYTLAYADITLNGLLTKVALYLDAVLPGSLNMTLAPLTGDQRSFLINQLEEVVSQSTEDEFLSVEAIDSLSKIEEAWVEEFVGFAGGIRKDHIVAAGIDCLRDIMPDIRAIRGALRSGQVNAGQLMATTGYLPETLPNDDYLGLQHGWKIGGPGNDSYRGDYSFILDLGGDDVYTLEYDPAHPHGVIIIDLGGNDTYQAASNFALGSGCLSVGLLLDFEGDDRYRAKSYGLGSGWFGFGLLYDASGDDRYDGDTHVQGAATFGIGLLIDESGRDIYNAAIYSQGFGFVQGGGLVYDMDGSDSYYAGGKYKDINRYTEHYLSMSQGFAFGMRPWMSGGVGGIIDLKGNDSYNADIFGQGSGYWWSLGMIYDSSGLDNYNCFQYGQGSGTHMALGIVVDDHDNDFYIGGGVMQGCGHDYACGILVDRDGDDTYLGRDKVQGDGSANGIGLLMDLAGSDRYFAGNPGFAQGAGDPRRGFGSIGLFVDLGGLDTYHGPGRDNSFWKAARYWGGGMDIELNPPDTTEEEGQ
jgi:hypothetical protein